jgi:hypothetical protein
LTKSLIADSTVAVSGCVDRLLEPVFNRFSVVPWIASLTVLLALVTAMPFTVSLRVLRGHRLPQVLRRRGIVVQQILQRRIAGHRDAHARGFSPVCEDVSTSRLGVPLPSFTMLAETPAFAALIASRMPSSVLLVPSMVMGTAVLGGVRGEGGAGVLAGRGIEGAAGHGAEVDGDGSAADRRACARLAARNQRLRLRKLRHVDGVGAGRCLASGRRGQHLRRAGRDLCALEQRRDPTASWRPPATC